MDPKVLSVEQPKYFIQQFFTGCLAEMAYYVESESVAVIIDPMREYQRYIDLAAQRKATIQFVFETHFHADFISGHIDLARETGSTIVYGPTASPKYPVRVANDEEVFQIGAIELKVLHTPGHTPESSSFLLSVDGTAQCIFTGDTLFLGDVGRPDLTCDAQVSKEQLAGQLFDSLQNKIVGLPKEITVYPAHGAGSSCGKNISDGTFDSLANQFKTNWALQEGLTKQAFVERLVNISAPPQYYFFDAKINREGYESLDIQMSSSNKGLSASEVKTLVEEGTLVIDGRSNAEFLTGFIPGSFFMSLGMPFAQWVGTLIKPVTSIVLVTPSGKEAEAILRLARIGYINVKGYLEGGISSWQTAGYVLDTASEISATNLLSRLDNNESLIALDVRKPDELTNHGSVKGLKHFELNFIESQLTENPNLLPKDQPIYVMCRSGQRSVVAISIMRKFGYNNLINVSGGFIEAANSTSQNVVKPQ